MDLSNITDEHDMSSPNCLLFSSATGIIVNIQHPSENAATAAVNVATQ